MLYFALQFVEEWSRSQQNVNFSHDHPAANRIPHDQGAPAESADTRSLIISLFRCKWKKEWISARHPHIQSSLVSCVPGKFNRVCTFFRWFSFIDQLRVTPTIKEKRNQIKASCQNKTFTHFKRRPHRCRRKKKHFPSTRRQIDYIFTLFSFLIKRKNEVERRNKSIFHYVCTPNATNTKSVRLRKYSI